jgi:hypothetical protein
VFEAELPDFNGKVVVAMQEPGQGGSWTLVNARFEKQAGGLVLVGKPFEHEGTTHWSYGTTVYIPWKFIACYVVYDSVEDYVRKGIKSGTAVPQNVSRRGWLRRR